MSIADMATANARSIAGITEKPMNEERAKETLALRETIMKEYIAKGTLTLTGVTFYISAKSLDDAWVQFNVGRFDTYDHHTAESGDCQIDMDTIEENV